MNILFASKFYYRRAGLESYLFKAKELLEYNDHRIIPFSTNYSENYSSKYSSYFCDYLDISSIKKSNLIHNSKAFSNMIYNFQAYKNLKVLLKKNQVDIFQGFGITKHLSYSVFKAAKEMNIPTIMRLSDYALLCPNSAALDGDLNPCFNFDCYNNFNLKAIRKKCVKDNRLASAVGLLEVKINKFISGYHKNIDHFIAPSKFIRDIFIKQFNLKSDDISYLPVFYDVTSSISKFERGEFFLYAGRLHKEKGILTLLKAMRNQKLPLKIAGQGPHENEFKSIVLKENLNVEFLGFQKYDDLLKLINKSIAVVIPSEWFDNSPNIILEAYAQKKPVIASNMGGIPEMVIHNETGYLFESKNENELNYYLNEIIKNSKASGYKGYAFLMNKFNKASHYEQLMKIYNKVKK